MGLKSKLSKMKSFLFDEEEEKPKEKKVNKTEELKTEKKEVKEPIKSTNFDDFYFEDISSKEEIISDNSVQSRATTREPEFKFPEFNDDDFMPRVREEKKVEIKVKKEEKPLLYQGSKRREETKKFKPSPIISPIYGLLDEEGNMKKNDSKSNDTPSRKKEDVTIEDIRKKAYGTLDEEYENTMSRLSKKTIEEAEAEMEKEEKPKEKVSKAMVSYKKKIDEDSDDDMILPNVNFKEIDIDKEHSKVSKSEKVVDKEENDEDTKEQDLFNLIDTIYSGEESDK